MPPFSRTLADEGAVFHHLPIVAGGALDEPAIRAVLDAGRARRPDDNVADLVAQIAANRAGADLLLAVRQACQVIVVERLISSRSSRRS